MSEDLIRRSDVIEALKDNMVEMGGEDFSEIGVHSDDIDAIINDIPTIEPKRGEWLEWIDCEGEVFWKCSACGQVSEASVAGILYKFCPFCGARMKGAGDDYD